jgi:hypothetical protein
MFSSRKFLTGRNKSLTFKSEAMKEQIGLGLDALSCREFFGAIRPEKQSGIIKLSYAYRINGGNRDQPIYSDR